MLTNNTYIRLFGKCWNLLLSLFHFARATRNLFFEEADKALQQTPQAKDGFLNFDGGSGRARGQKKYKGFL